MTEQRKTVAEALYEAADPDINERILNWKPGDPSLLQMMDEAATARRIKRLKTEQEQNI